MPLRFDKLREISKIHIARSPENEPLYEAEEQLYEKLESAAEKLGETLGELGKEGIEREDGISLELASLLSRYGSMGQRAATLIVERWGEADVEEEVPAQDPEGYPNPDREKTLELLSNMSAHESYRIDWVCGQFEECGFAVEKCVKILGLRINGRFIRLEAPDWGEAGIDPSDLLNTIFNIFTDEQPQSQMGGRGFRYNDILAQLKQRI
ncbi:MAG: hypothetical protein P1U58_14255 [Verrucomicrobiales bacterium]|nr:hypothetical protein [Verrucomicrobiales bacterium]